MTRKVIFGNFHKITILALSIFIPSHLWSIIKFGLRILTHVLIKLKRVYSQFWAIIKEKKERVRLELPNFSCSINEVTFVLHVGVSKVNPKMGNPPKPLRILRVGLKIIFIGFILNPFKLNSFEEKYQLIPIQSPIATYFNTFY